MIITIQHFRDMGYCIGGVKREFFRNGANKEIWKSFIKNGIDEKTILSINNSMAHKVVQFAKEKGEQ